MKQFKNVLVYAGGEVDPTPGLERAVAMAKSNRARLTIVDVLPEAGTESWMGPSGETDLGRMLVEIRREELEDLAAERREEGLEIGVRVLGGKPFVELIREVQRRNHDLVIKTAQGSGGPLDSLLGSVAFHLLRKCPCPVWVVKPGDRGRGRVVAAVAPDLADPSGDPLTRRVLELASSLAHSRGVELEIVHAWHLWAESKLRSRRFNLPPEEIDALVENTGIEAEAAVQEALCNIDLSEVSYRTTVVQGTPFEVIAEATQRADVAVLGTLSRVGIAGVLIGNTAERVLRQIDCSVIAVKPPGFQSPIQLPSGDAG